MLSSPFLYLLLDKGTHYSSSVIIDHCFDSMSLTIVYFNLLRAPRQLIARTLESIDIGSRDLYNYVTIKWGYPFWYIEYFWLRLSNEYLRSVRDFRDCITDCFEVSFSLNLESSISLKTAAFFYYPQIFKSQNFYVMIFYE